MKELKPKIKIERPERVRVSREEAIKRVKTFLRRKEKLIAAIRKETIELLSLTSLICHPLPSNLLFRPWLDERKFPLTEAFVYGGWAA